MAVRKKYPARDRFPQQPLAELSSSWKKCRVFAQSHGPDFQEHIGPNIVAWMTDVISARGRGRQEDQGPP